MITKEQAEIYRDRFLEYMQATEGEPWETRKRESHLYASTFLPGIDMHTVRQEAFATMRHGVDVPEDYRLAFGILQSLGSRLSQMKTGRVREVNKSRAAKMQALTLSRSHTKQSRKSETAYTQVKAWCDENGFIPTPSCLGHFGTHDLSSYSRAMSQLRDEGYVIERDGVIGYRVTRPNEVAAEISPAKVEANQIATIVAAVMKAIR